MTTRSTPKSGGGFFHCPHAPRSLALPFNFLVIPNGLAALSALTVGFSSEFVDGCCVIFQNLFGTLYYLFLVERAVFHKFPLL